MTVNLNRLFISRFLEMKGLRFELAADGAEAVHWVKQKTFDIILMDCQMPKMNGYDATAAIRKLESGNRHTPIIAMTANAMKEDADLCYEAGMDDYLSKPLDGNQVIDLITKYTDIENMPLFREEKRKAQRQPLSDLSAESKHGHALPGDTVPAESKPIILIVDDEPMNVKLLEYALMDEYIVLTATNGKDALAIASSHEQPDIILLDIMMPEMDGYEVCIRLREMPETKEIPVVLLTALQEVKSEEYALKLGVVDYITKPFSIAIVKGRIRNHIEQKKYRDHQKENSYIDELTQIF